VLGPGFVISHHAVVPGLQLMITGGVEPTQQNLTSWFKSGAVCVGLGSQLFNKELLAKKDWAQLQQNVADLLKLAKEIKNNL